MICGAGSEHRSPRSDYIVVRYNCYRSALCHASRPSRVELETEQHEYHGQPVRALPAMTMRRPVSPITRVVVGVDDSVGSAATLRWAAAQACRRETVLRIVSARDEPRKLRPPYAGNPVGRHRLRRVRPRPCHLTVQPRRGTGAVLWRHVI